MAALSGSQIHRPPTTYFPNHISTPLYANVPWYRCAHICLLYIQDPIPTLLFNAVPGPTSRYHAGPAQVAIPLYTLFRCLLPLARPPRGVPPVRVAILLLRRLLPRLFGHRLLAHPVVLL